MRELSEDFDIVLVAVGPDHVRDRESDWELSRAMTRIVTVPSPEPGPLSDPEWGPWSTLTKATLRSLLPGRLPAFFDTIWSEEIIAQLRALVRDLPIDAVWASRSWMGEMARLAGIKKIIVDIDDFEGRAMMERLARLPSYQRRPLHQLQARHLTRYERSLPKRFDALCICKGEDTQFLGNGRASVHVVPNGIELPAPVSGNSRRPADILFVGALWFDPNIDALRFFIRDVWPGIRAAVDGASLTVAGRAPITDDLKDELMQAGAEVHESPASVSEFYSRASLCVAPLLTGGGTSIKVLESLAYGVPTVATSVAVRGLGLENGEHIAVADSPDAFRDACVELLSHRDRASAMAMRGRENVGRRFSWSKIGATARAAVHGLLAPAR
jgi:glycosyltransferase involved in cell wall biosynthesis